MLGRSRALLPRAAAAAARRQLAGSAAAPPPGPMVPVFKVATLGFTAYSAWCILPFVYHSTVPSAIQLCRSKDAFMQRTGVSRLKVVVMSSDSCRRDAFGGDAVPVLLRLLQLTAEAAVQHSILEVMQRLIEPATEEERQQLLLSGAEPALAALAAGKASLDDDSRARATELLLALRTARAEAADAKASSRDL